MISADQAVFAFASVLFKCIVLFKSKKVKYKYYIFCSWRMVNVCHLRYCWCERFSDPPEVIPQSDSIGWPSDPKIFVSLDEYGSV